MHMCVHFKHTLNPMLLICQSDSLLDLGSDHQVAHQSALHIHCQSQTLGMAL